MSHRSEVVFAWELGITIYEINSRVQLTKPFSICKCVCEIETFVTA